jgi:hypothetical protein
MTIRMKGFITGLTSVFIPAMSSETVLLPTYSRKTHSIGREAQCDLVFNESLQCHVVFSLKSSNCSHFNTLLQRKSDDVEGLVSVQFFH